MRNIIRILTFSIIFFTAMGLVILIIQGCLWANNVGLYLLGVGLILFIVMHASDMILKEL